MGVDTEEHICIGSLDVDNFAALRAALCRVHTCEDSRRCGRTRLLGSREIMRIAYIDHPLDGNTCYKRH